MGSRPSWSDYFMTAAFLAAQRSTCDRAHVGAVLVKDNRIIATGYNGAPTGWPSCDDEGHLMDTAGEHCIRTIHAEHNAILQCAITGVSPVGATLYVTHKPCQRCEMLIAQVGITGVNYVDTL